MKKQAMDQKTDYQNSWLHQPTGIPLLRQNNSGQIIIEYVLLLVMAVTIATILTRAMIRKDPSSPGFVISAWNAVLKEIGQDKPDDLDRK
jgi:hypothetical protein